jgi:hypothetical protein
MGRALPAFDFIVGIEPRTASLNSQHAQSASTARFLPTMWL